MSGIGAFAADAAVCRDLSAVDADGTAAVVGSVSAADRRCSRSAGRGDYAAVDRNVERFVGEIGVIVSCADACAAVAAGRIHNTAVDGNRCESLCSAADTCRVIAALCGDAAAVDHDGSDVLVAAADARAVFGAGRIDNAAVDRDQTGGFAAVAAADARISSGVDLAAVDRNSAGASGDLA